MLNSLNKQPKKLSASYSLNNSSSFIQCPDGTIKRKRHKSSYKDIYLEKLNFVPTQMPAGKRRDSGYSTFYQNNSVNISRDDFKFNTEESGLSSKRNNKSTINLHNDASFNKTIGRVKSMSYVNGPRNMKKNAISKNTNKKKKVPKNSGGIKGTENILAGLEKDEAFENKMNSHNDSSTIENEKRFTNVRSVGVLKTKYNAGTIPNLVLGKKGTEGKNVSDKVVTTLKSKFTNANQNSSNNLIEGTLLDNNEKGDIEDLKEMRNRLDTAIKDDNVEEISPRGTKEKKETIDVKTSNDIMYGSNELNLSPIHDKLNDNANFMKDSNPNLIIGSNLNRDAFELENDEEEDMKKSKEEITVKHISNINSEIGTNSAEKEIKNKEQVQEVKNKDENANKISNEVNSVLLQQYNLHNKEVKTDEINKQKIEEVNGTSIINSLQQSHNKKQTQEVNRDIKENLDNNESKEEEEEQHKIKEGENSISFSGRDDIKNVEAHEEEEQEIEYTNNEEGDINKNKKTNLKNKKICRKSNKEQKDDEENNMNTKVRGKTIRKDSSGEEIEGEDQEEGNENNEDSISQNDIEIQNNSNNVENSHKEEDSTEDVNNKLNTLDQMIQSKESNDSNEQVKVITHNEDENKEPKDNTKKEITDTNKLIESNEHNKDDKEDSQDMNILDDEEGSSKMKSTLKSTVKRDTKEEDDIKESNKEEYTKNVTKSITLTNGVNSKDDFNSLSTPSKQNIIHETNPQSPHSNEDKEELFNISDDNQSEENSLHHHSSNEINLTESNPNTNPLISSQQSNSPNKKSKTKDPSNRYNSTDENEQNDYNINVVSSNSLPINSTELKNSVLSSQNQPKPEGEYQDSEKKNENEEEEEEDDDNYDDEDVKAYEDHNYLRHNEEIKEVDEENEESLRASQMNYSNQNSNGKGLLNNKRINTMLESFKKKVDNMEDDKDLKIEDLEYEEGRNAHRGLKSKKNKLSKEIEEEENEEEGMSISAMRNKKGRMKSKIETTDSLEGSSNSNIEKIDNNSMNQKGMNKMFDSENSSPVKENNKGSMTENINEVQIKSNLFTTIQHKDDSTNMKVTSDNNKDIHSEENNNNELKGSKTDNERLLEIKQLLRKNSIPSSHTNPTSPHNTITPKKENDFATTGAFNTNIEPEINLPFKPTHQMTDSGAQYDITMKNWGSNPISPSQNLQIAHQTDYVTPAKPKEIPPLLISNINLTIEDKSKPKTEGKMRLTKENSFNVLPVQVQTEQNRVKTPNEEECRVFEANKLNINTEANDMNIVNIKGKSPLLKTSENELQSDGLKSEIDDFISHLKQKNKNKDDILSDLKQQKEEELRHLREKSELLAKQRQEALKRKNTSITNINLNGGSNTADKTLEMEARIKRLLNANTNNSNSNSNTINKETEDNIVNQPQAQYNTNINTNMNKIKSYVSIFSTIDQNPIIPSNKLKAKKDNGNDLNMLNRIGNERDLDFFDIERYQNLKNNFNSNKNKYSELFKNENLFKEKNTYLNKVKEDVKSIEIKKRFKEEYNSNTNKFKFNYDSNSNTSNNNTYNVLNRQRQKIKFGSNFVMPANSLEDVLDTKDHFFFSNNTNNNMNNF